VCPVILLTPLSSVPVSDIQAKVMAVLKDGITSEEASMRAASCIHCATCQNVCPQDINPLTLQELLQLELVNLGQKRHPLMEIMLGDRICFLPDILASMQIKPEEKRWLSHVPDKPQQKDVVVFTGCALVMMPDKIFLIFDILERLGLDFVIVAGGELCCGTRYLGANLDKADAYGKALLHALGTFNPQQVIFCCAGCAYYVSRLDKEISPAHFKYDELFHFLSRHITELEFTQPVNKTVTLHDPCSFSRGLGDIVSLRTLLKAIPGLKLIEMNRNKEQSICCGVAARRKMPEVAQTMVRQCLEEAAKTGAEVMVDACQGCHLQFCPEESKYPFQVKHLLTLIGEAMGIAYEDKIKKFYLCGDEDRIMAESRENIEASSYDLNLTAYLAKYIFVGQHK
ncbi:MAG: (Fe-S)-binding protein, partial [Chloroflexi bacterium]|nr:(Fe-S)-binding protein [Chloroflexota bacterium]